MANGTVRWFIVPDEAGGDLYLSGVAYSADVGTIATRGLR